MRFLKRIGELSKGNQRVSRSPTQENLRLDLENLLNTRLGNASIEPSMGLPDFRSYFQGHEEPDIETLTSAIKFQIAQFERRLKDISVTHKQTTKVGLYQWLLQASVTETMGHFQAQIKADHTGRLSVEEHQDQ